MRPFLPLSYLYDSGTPVCELNSNVAVQNMFGALPSLVSRNVGSGTTFYAFDERGNRPHLVADISRIKRIRREHLVGRRRHT